MGMKLLSPAISRLARLRRWRIGQWISMPIESQFSVWQYLLAEGQYTAYGRQYGFDTIQSVKDFQQAAPIITYEDIQPYINRMMEGEENVLWNTPVEWFAKRDRKSVV